MCSSLPSRYSSLRAAPLGLLTLDSQASTVRVDTPLWRRILGQAPFPATYRDFLTAMQRFTAQMDRIIQRYGERQIPLDLFLSELDNTARLIFSEQP